MEIILHSMIIALDVITFVVGSNQMDSYVREYM